MAMEKNEKLIALGKAIRILRIIRGEKAESMASKLSYHDSSSFTKIERAEITGLDIIKLFEICEILEVSLSNLCMMAEINLSMHEGNITSWEDFYKNVLQKRNDEIMNFMKLLPTPDQG